MKKYLQFALMIFCMSVVFTSCKDDDDSDDVAAEAWKLENEQAFAAKANDLDFRKISISGGGDDFIYKKIIKEGNEPDIPIYYNSRVTVYYRGWLINSKDGEYSISKNLKTENLLSLQSVPPLQITIVIMVQGSPVLY